LEEREAGDGVSTKLADTLPFPEKLSFLSCDTGISVVGRSESKSMPKKVGGRRVASLADGTTVRCLVLNQGSGIWCEPIGNVCKGADSYMWRNRKIEESGDVRDS
jgi:hypothetical protein